jgi:HD-GYP domain-containing protein (c-di-GMP phosphodiesterase class II)
MVNLNVLEGILEHHERVNGKGYPLGINGDNINKFSKIISVCDVFTAMSSNRCHRDRFNPNEAYEYILCNAGTMFDEEVVTKFKQSFYIYPLGIRVKLSNGLEGYVVRQNESFPDRAIVRVSYENDLGGKSFYYDIDLLNTFNITIASVVA